MTTKYFAVWYEYYEEDTYHKTKCVSRLFYNTPEEAEQRAKREANKCYIGTGKWEVLARYYDENGRILRRSIVKVGKE